MAKKEGLWGVIKAIFKFIFVLIVAFFESVTLSYYRNVRKWYSKRNNEYKEVKVPKGYVDEKAGPEYPELNGSGGYTDFSGLPGMK
jgi:hypothetical protein